jgi:hypothetical protein
MAKINLEYMMLGIFFLTMMFLGPGEIFGNKISHDYPFGYGASDAFQHQTRAEFIKDTGNFRYEADYISKGFEDVIGRYPPILYHISVIFSQAAGIEVYDSIFLIVLIFGIISSLLFYFVIKLFNPSVALLSLPLSILIFSNPNAIGYLWGHWPALLSQSFLVLLFWSMSRFELKNSYLFVSISLIGMFLTHSSEFIFGVIFLILFFAIRLIFKKSMIKEFRSMLIAAGIFFVATGYYIIIFLNTWVIAQPYEFLVQPIWEGNPGFYLTGFGILLIFMVLGLAYSFKELKGVHCALVAALAMLIGGFTNYIGFDVRAFQIRFFWPIYLSVFFGLGSYLLLKLVIKRYSSIYSVPLFLILITVFSGMISFPAIANIDNQKIPLLPSSNLETNSGLMDPEHWESLRWISENTEKDSKVYFFYGDIYTQDALLRNSKRVHYLVDPEDFINSLNNRELKQKYVTETPGDSGGMIAVRKSLFEFEYVETKVPKEEIFGLRDICDNDYIVFDKITYQEVLGQYNQIIGQNLLENDYIFPVFDNRVVTILKNDKPGVICIDEGNF